jgi:hypothetical protein
MWNKFRALMARLNQQSWQALKGLGMADLVKFLPDGTRLMDFANRRIFAHFDKMDVKSAHFKKYFWRNMMLQQIIMVGLGACGYYYVKGIYQHIRETQGNADLAYVAWAVSPLKMVLTNFVFENEYIQKLLADILCTNVLASPKVSFVLGRTIGRTVADPGIQDNLKVLVKKNVLKENVLYSSEVYHHMKSQLIRQFRGDNLRGLIRDQTSNFVRSETCHNLAAQNLADTFRLKPVKESFVEGVVDKSIYRMIQDKDNARKLDNQLYEILK